MKTYRLTVKIPETAYKHIVTDAEEKHISLNAAFNRRLRLGIGFSIYSNDKKEEIAYYRKHCKLDEWV